jgi:hypothetical protein
MHYRFQKLFCKILLTIFFGWILMALAVPVHAGDDEQTVARNFLKFLRSDKTILSSELLQGTLLDPNLPPVIVGHLFKLQGGGYLLVSPDRGISPVKAYSLVGEFSALPEPYRKALLSELELRARVALAGTGRAPLDAGMTETEKQWDFLLQWDAGRVPLSYAPGNHLLETEWDQGYPYNKFLPAVGGKTVAAGCVNVAVAQVMRYHRYPASSKGVASYVWDGPPSQTLKTILYRSFNWANMPESIDGATSEYQADEVALLIRDIGIANHTDFDFSGSSTSLNSQALIENFGYSTSLSEMSNSSTSFLATLKSEIDAERPVLLTFPGHMTVADGYSADNSGRKVHVNMGWGGSADDFYFLDDPLDPWVHTGSYNFPTTADALRIHYNIKPCSVASGDCAVNLEAGDGINNFAVAGNFNQAKDTDLYEVYLSGATTIRGTRGYSNIGFFVSIANLADGSVFFPAPDPGNPADTIFAAGSLTAGKYVVRVSLCNAEGTYCFSPGAGFDHYTVILTSGTLTAEQKAAIDRGLEKPPVIGNTFPDLILNTATGTRRILIDARDENGDPVALEVWNSNPAAVGAVLNGNILELTPTGTAKVSSRIAVSAAANGKTAEKAFTVMTDNGETGFGKAFTVGGTFTGQNDVKIHRVTLDGACTIAGDRSDYSNQAFFSSVLDASDHVVASADGFNSSVISASFNRGIYRLRGAICIPGSCYTLTDSDAYAFTVSCPDADESTATIAGLLGIDLAGANLPFEKPGDVDGNGTVTLADALLVLQMLSGMDMTGKTVVTAGDANVDRRIGLAEALFVLQRAAGLRSP